MFLLLINCFPLDMSISPGGPHLLHLLPPLFPLLRVGRLGHLPHLPAQLLEQDQLPLFASVRVILRSWILINVEMDWSLKGQKE